MLLALEEALALGQSSDADTPPHVGTMSLLKLAAGAAFGHALMLADVAARDKMGLHECRQTEARFYHGSQYNTIPSLAALMKIAIFT